LRTTTAQQLGIVSETARAAIMQMTSWSVERTAAEAACTVSLQVPSMEAILRWLLGVGRNKADCRAARDLQLRLSHCLHVSVVHYDSLVARVAGVMRFCYTLLAF
jgi:hypothetical protein